MIITVAEVESRTSLSRPTAAHKTCIKTSLHLDPASRVLKSRKIRGLKLRPFAG